MSVFRVEKTKDFTIMSNHHLKNKSLTLKSKGLLSLMLSLPEEWDYTLKGLACICKEGVDAIRVAVSELEKAGYIERKRKRNEKGQLADIEYIIHEFPICMNETTPKSDKPMLEKPTLENPILDNPTLEKPVLEKPTSDNPTQLNTNILNTKELNTDCIKYPSINHDVGEKTNGTNDRWIDRYEKNIEIVKNNIEYDSIANESDKSVIDEIVTIMAEVLTVDTPYYTIENKQYPSDIVKQRFMEVNYDKLSAFLLEFDRHTDKIRNPKAYLITALFNMPATADTWSFINSGFPASAIGHGTQGQIAKCSRISWNQAQAGDLAFLSDLSHVGIIAGKDTSGNILVIHCSSSANNVVITSNSIFGFAARPSCY